MDFKYYELDKSISREIMGEFKGKVIPSICPNCKGRGCDECNDTGSIDIEY